HSLLWFAPSPAGYFMTPSPFSGMIRQMSSPEPVTAHTDRRTRIKAVFRVATGNFLEMYDFMVFGYYAAPIGRTFFPKSSEFASLMLTFATFGVGFLIRPLGALVLGAYMDRKGRRAGLML